MRVPVRSQPAAVGINMTPMIDVVFQLIIFFLLASHLARNEVQLELDLPNASSGERADDDSHSRVTINLVPQGQIALGNDPVTPQQLTERLQVEAGERGADLEVRIRSDRAVPYREVEPILLACSRAGVWNVTFAVTRKEP